MVNKGELTIRVTVHFFCYENVSLHTYCFNNSFIVIIKTNGWDNIWMLLLPYSFLVLYCFGFSRKLILVRKFWELLRIVLKKSVCWSFDKLRSLMYLHQKAYFKAIIFICIVLILIWLKSQISNHVVHNYMVLVKYYWPK